MLPITCWPQRMPTRTWQQMSMSTVRNLNSIQLFPSRPRPCAHPQSGRPYSQEKPPTLEDLYYYAESIQKRTGAEEEDQQQVGNDEPRPSKSGQDGSRLKSTKPIDTSRPNRILKMRHHGCIAAGYFQTVKVARNAWIKCGVCKAWAHAKCAMISDFS